MTPAQYRLVLTPTARSRLAAITDGRTRERVRDRIDGLAGDPELQGKALLGELQGDRSLRAAGQRYLNTNARLATALDLHAISEGAHCINYAGVCGAEIGAGVSRSSACHVCLRRNSVPAYPNLN